MAGLQAENMNHEFLRNFIPEALYLVDGEFPAPKPETQSLESEQQAANPTVQADTQAEVQRAQTEPAKKATPAIPKVPKAADAVPDHGKYKITGENRKGVVVLVTVPDQEYQKLPQLEFLQKILYAIGLQTADVAYVNNISRETAKFEDLQEVTKVNYIISFASRLDTDLPHEKFTLYNPVTVGKVPVVFSQALSLLERDVEHKKMLWGALQKVFL